MSAHLPRWSMAGLLALHMLGGCAPSRHAVPGRYELSTTPGTRVDTPSNAAQTQPELFIQVPGEEQVINPSWLPAATAATVTGVALAVTVVELNERQRREVEEVLQRCAQEAEREVNWEEFQEHRSPRPEDCLKVLGKDKEGKEIIWAQVAGEKKHHRALQCAARELGARYPGQVLIEPRYRYFPGADRLEYVPPHKVEWLLQQGLYSELKRTFSPDIVLIAEGSPFKIRAVYDFKFPCLRLDDIPRWGDAPEWSRFSSQGAFYHHTLKVKPLRITPRSIESNAK